MREFCGLRPILRGIDCNITHPAWEVKMFYLVFSIFRGFFCCFCPLAMVYCRRR
nr:MAG TPA: hypothetical protein [Caudoviricetes sp.]